MTQPAFKRPGISRVFLGLHSLDAPASIDQPKLRMGYVAKPVRQRVVFHPLLAPLLNKASHAAVNRLLGRYSHSPRLAKPEGMVRFYLEGPSTGDFEPVFRALLGETAPLSASSIICLKEEWQAEFEAWCGRRLDQHRYLYLWVDGV